jgi:hypothetical protein
MTEGSWLDDEGLNDAISVRVPHQARSRNGREDSRRDKTRRVLLSNCRSLLVPLSLSLSLSLAVYRFLGRGELIEFRVCDDV